MPNGLADATSPYLLQHADNPVDWRPWGDDAFAEARRRDVPVLLSVGYAACHWCHVMAHESFEDPHTAELMNDGFVNVKVDREERPDVDAVYMEATQAMTGQGGWPMTVFLTPDGAPFYCGTYFPREHFQRLLAGIGQAWREDRAAVLGQGQRVVDALSAPRPLGGTAAPGADELAAAVRGLAADYDEVRGGFGGAPKFPPSMLLEFLLRHHARTSAGAAGPGSTGAAALRMARHTAEAMARGGMYDQIGGGFARYSVDAHWTVPHFEKMLYDNALLLRAYTHLWRATGDRMARRVALDTADWLVADLRTPEGGFASALDADSEGEEGRYYVWTPAQLREALGEEDGAWAARLFGVTEEGTFEHGSSVLRLLGDPDGGGPDAVDPERYTCVRTALLRARADRVPPARDDKVVAAWNGLAIAGLAEAGALLDRPDLVHRAREAARLLVDLHLSGDRLVRTSRHGTAGTSAGVLEDYGDVAEGLLTLHAVTGEAEWVAVAGRLLDAVLRHFGDGHGGLYDTADDAETLFNRPQDPTDNATPSGRSAAAGALLSYAALTGSPRHRAAAEAALGPVVLLAAKVPRFAGWGLAVAEAALAGPLEIAVVGAEDDPAAEALHRAALLAAAPGTVVSRGDGTHDGGIGLLRDRPLVDGGPAGYVCRGFTCRLPVTTPEGLREQIAAG
ncbi:thioredoxin domain-containing protein [Marinitenerispora sediminis]|uniref:N-acylglucosamine 2-epimerase n=1 Tax=Marinitenerispora sediminis TaxID=1931232 RepID=A0A368TBQ3_9ACTN|nr:thioredoxin domain-containing protein [Marinitenerispora sediminis]RCV54401.1 N-acylglucosamine 2-epimerase [Marinitenerispora sediminis]RCV61130.1 N-acylglucosamine 2-epimerase [Marinitenerispora sediminis]RCV62406.1 N-acylglucosamine 2-epimerase [Marinitenerispora sediminis]